MFNKVMIAAVLALSLATIGLTSGLTAPTPPAPAYGHSGIIIPYESRIDFFDEDTHLSAYTYDSEAGFFLNPGAKFFIVAGTELFAALAVDPAHVPATNKSGVYLLINNGSSLDLKQVEMGAVDSAGSGYRTLRVVN